MNFILPGPSRQGIGIRVNDEINSLNLVLMLVAAMGSQTSLLWREGLREGSQNGRYILLEFRTIALIRMSLM